MRCTRSKTRTQLLCASCRSSRLPEGRGRAGTVEGSIRERRACASTDLPLPVEPVRTNIGYGPAGGRPAAKQGEARGRPPAALRTTRGRAGEGRGGEGVERGGGG